MELLETLTRSGDAVIVAHRNSVIDIANSIRKFHAEKQPWRVYHGGSNSTRRPQYSRKAIVDTSGLTHVLKIDHGTKRAIVQPNVSMGHLVKATLEHGLMPAVVMEFPAITVGGGFSGNSGESSSWKYGLFDETITSIQIVLASGEVKHVSDSVNPDLFHGAAGGHGTLGVVTALEVQCLDSKEFVEAECFPVRGAEEALTTMQRLSEEDEHLYIDGIMIGPSQGIIMAGKLVSQPSKSTPVVNFTRARDQWFYRYIEKRHRSGASSTFRFATPLASYLFRYDRGAFWGGKYAFDYMVTPYNRVSRFFLNPLLHASTMFRALHGSGLASQTIVQDIGVPQQNLPAFLAYLNQKFGFEYWWLCPIRHRPDRQVSFAYSRDGETSLENGLPNGPADMWINVGIWGRGSANAKAFAADNRELENKTHELGGLKALYARTYYTQDEFWQVYDKETYDTTRRKYDAEMLPSLYDKVNAGDGDVVEKGWRGQLHRVGQTRPLPGLRGILSLAKAKAYLFSS